jgi:hypothetical protein
MAYQTAVGASSTYLSSAVTATPTSRPPSLYDYLKGATAQVLNVLLLDNTAILPAAVDSFNMYNDSSALVPTSPGQAPGGGIVFTAPQSDAPSGTTALYGLENVDGTFTETELAAPDAQGSVATFAPTTVIVGSPVAGTYAGNCSIVYGPTSVCSEGACDFFPSTPITTPSDNLTLADAISFVSGPTGEGCSIAPNVIEESTSFSVTGGCTAEAPDSTPQTIVAACSATLQ